MEFNKQIKIMIIAGEASGDILGAELMAELTRKNSNITFCGVGGGEMKKIGLKPLFPMEDLSLMGIAEVIPHLPKLFKHKNELVNLAKEQQVDLLLTIDSPDFNLRVAKAIKKELDIPCVHYVSPSIWAWREGRVAKMAKYLDHVLALFPFEPSYYKKVGLPCTYVGHPVSERLMHLAPAENNLLLEDDIKIALLPGSRYSEITKLLPVMLKVFKQLKDEGKVSRAIIPVSDKSCAKQVAKIIGAEPFITIVEGESRYGLLKSCTAAIVTSGTANLELAMLGVPMVVVYKTGTITYAIAKYLIKVPYISPVNWVAGEKIIPELIQGEATEDALYSNIIELITPTIKRQVQVKSLVKVRHLLQTENSSSALATKVILDLII